MKNPEREVLAEVVEECAQVLAANKGRYRKFPVEFKLKVFKLRQMGVSAKELSQSLEQPVGTIYSWIKKKPRKKVAGSILTKKLRLKKSNSELPHFNSESKRVIFGKLTFKSGVCLEVPIEQIDGRLLNLLNELGH
jgi:transposase-like protein